MTTTTLPVPANDTELAEMLADPKRAAGVLESPQALTDFIKQYANRAQGDGTDLQRQIDEQAQRAVVAHLRAAGIDNYGASDVTDMRGRLNLTGGTPRNGGGYSNRAPGRKLDDMFADWESYLDAMWSGRGTPESMVARSKVKEIQNAFGSTIPSDGGFLIPERLRAELLRIALETAVVRPRARVVPMDSLTVPYPTIDATSNASSVYGGVVGYWTEEGAALTDSSPTFGRVVLNAKKLTVYSEVPNELYDDSIISLAAFMNQAYPEAISWFEDTGFCSGGGVGEPLGFLNADAAVSVTKESGQPAATIVWENIVKMYARMLPASIGRAVWVANINTFPELATMALSVGTGGSAVWIGNGDGAGAPPMTILGRPVVFTEKVSTLGTVGDINLVDFGYYLIGDRMAMQSATSTEFKFGSDKTSFRLIQRVDGRPWLSSAITPQNGSTTLSPFVRIETRS